MKKNNIIFLKRNQWLKAVPNLLTVCSSLFGFAAILNTLQAYVDLADAPTVFVISSWMILLAMIFDALDGFTARIFNAASLKGVHMDSLADMVTFGVAPAVLVAVMAHVYSATVWGYCIAWLFCALYLACAAHRLALYNLETMVEKKTGNKFYGLPTPGAAAAICSLVLLFGKHDIHHHFVKILPIYAGILGLLMVSKIRYQHVGKWLESVKRNRQRQLFLVLAVVCFLLSPSIVSVIIINAYVIWGIISYFFRIKRKM